MTIKFQHHIEFIINMKGKFMENNLKTTKKEEKTKTQSKNTKATDKNKIKETEKFKQKYFDYYDDIKSSTHKIVDW